jgi:hypothetical protein
MSCKLDAAIGIDIGKNSFHVVRHDRRGAIVLRRGSRICRLINPWEPLLRCGGRINAARR